MLSFDRNLVGIMKAKRTRGIFLILKRDILNRQLLVSSQSVFFSQGNDTVLNSEEQNICEGALTEKECLEALMSMDSNKTTGLDGLPAEFYKVFWKDIFHSLFPALNYAFESGSLSLTQRRGRLSNLFLRRMPSYTILKIGAQ